MKNFVLIDGFAMMFRSFYAVRFSPQYQGKNINAVYGCATTIMQAIEQFGPEKIVVALDAPEKTFRHELDPEYKAQRTEAPDEFIAQIDLVKDLIKAFNIPLLIKPGFEADDIIGTLVTQADDYHSYILSGDLDFLQLVSDRITLAKFNGKEPLLFDRQSTIEKLGLPPEQVIDYKALCGDSSDNYKGLPGLGPKGASKLLAEYPTLEAIYQNLEHLPEKQRAKFEEHKDYVQHCQYLATINKEVALEVTPDSLEKYEVPTQSIVEFFDMVGFRTLASRAQNLNLKSVQNKSDEQKKVSKKVSDEGQMSIF